MSGSAWITGASSGIGRALALRLADEGWRVAVSARDAEALAALSGAPESAGRLHPFPLDVTDAAAVEAGVAAIEAALGPLELIVLNAGTHQPMGAADFDAATARQLMEVNYMGVVHGLAAVLPRLRARRSGRVAVVASLAGYRGLPGAAAYGPTKAALINLCESLRPELDRDGVLLQLVNPGFVKTPLTDRNDFPMPFLMPLEKAAEAFRRGLAGRRFEIVFPRRFAALLRLGRCLPYALYFALTRRMTRP